MDISKNIVYFALDVDHRVDISHDWNLEDFLAKIYDNNKYKAMIQI